MKFHYALMAAILVLAACTPIANNTANNSTQIACTMDAKICPDGSAVGREGPNCEFAACPDATESAFREYKSVSAPQCMTMRFTCDGDEMFSDESGCGCIRQHNEAAVTLCTADYNPVCGWFDQSIQCFAYPCAQTYSNLCMASLNKAVDHTTLGECPATGSSPEGTVPQAAEEKYAELAEQYSTSVGAILERCVGDDIVFIASGSGGFVAESHYYDENGEFLGSVEFDDMVFPGEEAPQYPIDKEDYTCTIIRQSPESTPEIECERTKVCTETECETRPKACTREYNPVCGHTILNNGQERFETYSNSCTACNDMKVVNYAPGACEPEEKKQAIECSGTRPEFCTMQYDPVCAQRDDGTSYTAGNDCSACSDVEVISYVEGEC